MYGNVQFGVEIGFVGYFIVYGCQFWIVFQLFGYYGGVIKDCVDMIVLQVQFCILVVVVRYGSDFWMFIGDEFLVGGVVLYVYFFVFQLVNVGEFILLVDEQC